MLSVSDKLRFTVLIDLVPPDQPQQGVFGKVPQNTRQASIVQQVHLKLCPLQYEMSRKIEAQ